MMDKTNGPAFVRKTRILEPGQCDGRLSVKQRSAQLPLQRTDGGGERGLRDAAAAGRAGETELLAQGQEVMDLLHLHWSRLPFADRRADCSAGRVCSMLSLSQAGRLVLGSDLNRSESSWGAPDPSPVSGPMSASSPFGRSRRPPRPVRCPPCLRQRPSWCLASEPRDVRIAD